jgi:putative ABC transport system ATP-binding protein
VLSARELTKVYQMGEVQVHALRGVDMDLRSGEFLVLLGASGSGKSTLLNILGGLDTATSGTVVYRGQDLTSADDEELTEFRRAHVGFVFQFYNLIPSLTAEENVRLVSDIADDPMDPVDALELVGLGPRKDHFPSQLSGGEQTLERVNRELGTTTAVITHNVPIAQMANTVVELVDGQVSKIEHRDSKIAPSELRW